MTTSEGGWRFSSTDVAGFLECRHLARLEHAAAQGLLSKPLQSDLDAEAVALRGQRHEARVLREFEMEGWGVTDLSEPRSDLAARGEATQEALRSGTDVVYQGVLLHDERIGLPDFLVRADLLSGLAGYEVVDAKLARTAKARAVLQASFYSRLLADVTGEVPGRLHLALGNGALATFRVPDVAAYDRQIERLFRAFTSGPPVYPPQDTYPEPVEHCAVCAWQPLCIERRRADDDLSLVAGMRSRQRKALKATGISTRRAFAALDPLPALDHVGKESLAKAQAQALIQVKGEDEERWLWEFVDPARDEGGNLILNRGLLALPEPADGDLFFDIEGARYYSEDGKEFGLQYLFGVIDSAEIDDQGRPHYHAFWAFDRTGERTAFEDLVDFMTDRLRSRPEAHVYHYNHYEPTALEHLSELHITREDALRLLMGRFATREEEVDDLLRRQAFVDLYRVVRQGIRASVESYSLKRLEPLYAFLREVELADVNERIVGFEIALDDGEARSDLLAQQAIRGYNEDDCRSTLALRHWLEERRSDLARSLGIELPRPSPLAVERVEPNPEIEALRTGLLDGAPEDVAHRTPEQQARALLADLLEYHRREAKPAWWRYFYLRGLTDDELLDEPDAIAGLRFDGTGDTVKRSVLYRYRFPPQEHGFRDGTQAEDPRTGVLWAIHEVEDATGILTIARGPQRRDLPHPEALIEPRPQYNKTQHAENIRALASRVIQIGEAPWPRGPALDLLLRLRPDAHAQGVGPLREPSEDSLAAGRRIAVGLTGTCLPVQGPPGTGKTYMGAWQVLDLAREGRRVGVTATSHAVICNLLDRIAEEARAQGISVRIGQKPGDDDRWMSRAARDGGRLYRSNGDVEGALWAGDVEVVGGTTWVWTDPRLEAQLDVLVVDEAGQMSLADVLASAQATANLILLGDPMQLAQPREGAHPPGSDVSALEHVLGDEATMPDHLGLFIDRTRRMHPDICGFTSEVFYEGRLTGIDGLERQAISADGPMAGSGIRVVDVVHEGNANASPEEALAVATVVRDLLTRSWCDRDGTVRSMGPEDVLVVTPFNAQIREIEDAMRRNGLFGIRVGTVDKFQGRQAPAVLYSMASSSAEEAPRGMEFLYDLHRLNVATSRAQGLAVVIANPDLVRVFCRTPRQMTLANALCRLREWAQAQTNAQGNPIR